MDNINHTGDFLEKKQLTIIDVNKWKTRSAYQGKQGEIYLDCSKCNLIINIEDFAATKKVFMEKFRRVSHVIENTIIQMILD